MFGPDCGKAGCVFATGCGIPIAVPTKRIKALEAASVYFIEILGSEAAISKKYSVIAD